MSDTAISVFFNWHNVQMKGKVTWTSVYFFTINVATTPSNKDDFLLTGFENMFEKFEKGPIHKHTQAHAHIYQKSSTDSKRASSTVIEKVNLRK